MKKIGVGIIGAGAIAEGAHLPAYSQMPEVRLVAIADVQEGRCKSLATKFGVPRCYKEYRQLLEDNDVQAVSICTPPDLHAEMTIAAAHAKKHVLCEKPMALAVEDADKMIQAAEKSEVKLMIGHSLRYSESLRTVKRLLTKGVIGEPVLARLELFSGGPAVSASVSKYYARRGS